HSERARQERGSVDHDRRGPRVRQSERQQLQRAIGRRGLEEDARVSEAQSESGRRAGGAVAYVWPKKIGTGLRTSIFFVAKPILVRYRKPGPPSKAVRFGQTAPPLGGVVMTPCVSPLNLEREARC